jgi:hypothetical protein
MKTIQINIDCDDVDVRAIKTLVKCELDDVLENALMDDYIGSFTMEIKVSK